MPDPDPIENLHRLRARLEQEAASRGLELIHFSYEPTKGPGPDLVQTVYEVDLAKLPHDGDDADLQVRAQFDQMMNAEAELDQERQVEQARAQMDRKLRDGDGFLGD